MIILELCVFYAGMYLSGLTPSKGINLEESKKISKNRFVGAEDLPQKFDWSTQNVIGPILDQEKVRSLLLLVHTTTAPVTVSTFVSWFIYICAKDVVFGSNNHRVKSKPYIY